MKFYVLKECYSHEEMYDIGSSTNYEDVMMLKKCMETRRVHDYPTYEIRELNTLIPNEMSYIQNHPSEPLWRVMKRDDNSYDAFQLEFSTELEFVNYINAVILRNSICFKTPDDWVIARAPDEETAIKYGKLLEETA